MYEPNVTDEIINVGVDDKEIKIFENQYELPDGMAYNSYLILDEKICVMDSVDADVAEQWLANLEQYLAGKTPDYIVVQHMEPDHSGSLEIFAQKYPGAKIITGVAALPMIRQFFGEELTARVETVKEGDSLSLGKHQLNFIAAPMVHWPEVIVTYEATSKTLFSADSFGKFGYKGAEADDWACEARRYYFNIVGKYGASVQTLLKKLEGKPLDHICPLHGPVLPENEPLDFYLKKYQTWSAYEPEDDGVAIVYASIHDTGTKQAALKLAEIFEAKGIKTGVTDLAHDDIHEGVEDAFRYNRLVLCASSYDGDVFPPMQQFLNILKIKAYQKRKVALVENGSWAPTAARVMRQYVDGFKNCEVAEPVVTIKSTMKPEDAKKLEELAENLLQ
ncbi:MAG: MBL fold metallo-hydrolase [Lachnospiraceae bacterium]|nr:MBL fold metallo-hydrolase [Lachnospiraceae bacterium]